MIRRRRTRTSLRWAGVRREQYRAELRACDATRWPAYLQARSGLPGPRANIELAQAVADEGDRSCFDRLIASGDEYPVFCGVVGLGRLMAEGADVQARVRGHATDARWRVREAVAMALQRLGDRDLPRLLDLVTSWATHPQPLVRRAAAAGVCEPRLLKAPEAAARAVDVCARVTQGLAADLVVGLPRFRALIACDDPDIAWIVRENSKKARLAKLL